MAESRWIDVGAVEELKHKPLQKSCAARRRSHFHIKTGHSRRSPESAITSAGRSVRVGSTVTTSSVPGTTGSFTTKPAKANRDTSRIRCRL